MTEKPAETNYNSFTLPPSFLYGAASSSHQVEGNCTQNDWWHEEQAGRLAPSLGGTDHYHRFPEDFALARQIGLNAMRISLEWSRIEPKPGKFDQAEIEHYRMVLQEMKAQGLTRMVTLFHFTLPLWFYQQGGFARRRNITAFVHYARFVAEQLGDEIDLWNTINEPEVFTYMSSVRGMWPPFARSPLRALAQFRNLAKAHNRAYQAIKAAQPEAQIGFAKNNVYNEAYRAKNWLDRLAVRLNDWLGNYWFLNMVRHNLDFVGLNYYFYHSLAASWRGIAQKNTEGPKSDMGWRTFPKGIYYLLTELARRYNKPIYITENGIANAHDDMRKDFIRQHLYWVSRAIADGADVRGYFYWSLTDTYEWHDGYNPKFGLIDINFDTLERKVRPSADIFKEIKNNL